MEHCNAYLRAYGVRSPPDPDILASELKVAVGPIVASKHAILWAVLVMLSDLQSRGSVFNNNSSAKVRDQTTRPRILIYGLAWKFNGISTLGRSGVCNVDKSFRSLFSLPLRNITLLTR
jgi:hypothetical protein